MTPLSYKLALLALVGVSTTTHAFMPTTIIGRQTTSIVLQSARPDATEAVKKAQEASEKYGPSSPEARLAWEVVEEMDASDNSEASKGSLADECEVSETVSKACMDYESKISEIKSLLGNFEKSKFEQMKALADEVAGVKLSQITKPKDMETTASPQQQKAVQDALAQAKAMTDKHGIDSPEARVAWETVEELAAAGLQNAVGGTLDEECDVNAAMEACLALEELNMALAKTGLKP